MVHHPPDRAHFALLGLGRFGALAARHLRERGRVLAWDPRPAGALSVPEDVALVPLPEACSARVVILTCPIGAIPSLLGRIAPLLRPPVLVADTASVKVWPCRWLLELLPPEVDLVGTHPLFGPDSAAAGLSGQKIAVVPLRLRGRRRAWRFLRDLGLTVVATTAEEHDEAMARSQSLVHWIGRALDDFGARPQTIDTMGYRQMLEILRYVTRDSLELFTDLQRWNPYAAGTRRRFRECLEAIEEALPADPADPQN